METIFLLLLRQYFTFINHTHPALRTKNFQRVGVSKTLTIILNYVGDTDVCQFFSCVCESGIIFIIEAPMSLQAAYKTKCKTHTYCLCLWTQPFPGTPNFISLQGKRTVNYLVAKQLLTFLCNQKRQRAKVLSKGRVSSLPSPPDWHTPDMYAWSAMAFNSLTSSGS